MTTLELIAAIQRMANELRSYGDELEFVYAYTRTMSEIEDLLTYLKVTNAKNGTP